LNFAAEDSSNDEERKAGASKAGRREISDPFAAKLCFLLIYEGRERNFAV
jgi:hypothetical protein